MVPSRHVHSAAVQPGLQQPCNVVLAMFPHQLTLRCRVHKAESGLELVFTPHAKAVLLLHHHIAPRQPQ